MKIQLYFLLLHNEKSILTRRAKSCFASTRTCASIPSKRANQKNSKRKPSWTMQTMKNIEIIKELAVYIGIQQKHQFKIRKKDQGLLT